jgi:transposase-like protein
MSAIEADTKLLITWLVGGRDGDYAIAFMDDLRDRLANRVQLTSDSHKSRTGAPSSDTTATAARPSRPTG